MTERTGKAALPAAAPYKAAGICFDPVLYDKAGNISGLSALAEEAARNGAKLIALPELGTTGYCFYDRADIQPYVEPIPGPTTNHFAAIARAYDCYLVVGMPEVDPATDFYYNTSVLIGPEGVLGKYRKTHSYIAEPLWCKQGDIDFPVFSTPIGNIAMLICMDIHYFETARILALRGADVIVHISCWLAEKAPAIHWLTRAFENGVYLVESDRYGVERGVHFSGGSCVIDPDGSIQAVHDSGDGIAYGIIDIRRARDKRSPNGSDKIRNRKPELYLDIHRDPYLWNPLDIFRLYQHDVLPSGKRSRVSVAQVRPVAGNIGENLKIVQKYTERAWEDSSELVVFPELMLTGLVDAEHAEATALPVDGESMAELMDLCMQYHIHIVVGLAEKDGECLYNTAVLLGPEGLIGKQRKVHLCDLDAGWATPGDQGFRHFNTPLGRVGILVGGDAIIPECGRILALSGVDLICCPAAVNFPRTVSLPETANCHTYPVPTAYCPIHWHLWRARAGENNCYLAFANQVGPYLSGPRCIGRSGIFGPDICEFPRREVILSANDESFATMEIDTSDLPSSRYPTNIVRAKDYLRKRQPLWYDIIMTKSRF